MREEVLLLGEPDALVGIVTIPDDAVRDPELPALLLLNSGMLHRVGPGRLYVKMARAMARAGFLVLRFDLSGIGDSSPRHDDHRPLEARWRSEVREAMDCLEESYGATHFGLTGICLGAKLSFLGACEDPRVVGAALINPQDHLHDGSNEALFSEIMLRANARHNWRMAFSSSMRGQKWRKALRGEVDFGGVARLLRNQAKAFFRRGAGHEASSDIEATFFGLRDRGSKVRHIYSEGDPGLDYLSLMLAGRLESYRASKALELEIIPGSNHTFTLLDNQEDLTDSVGAWAHTLARG